MHRELIVITTPNDPRLVMEAVSGPCWLEQWFDGPELLCVRPTATEEDLAHAATRFGVELDVLKRARGSR